MPSTPTPRPDVAGIKARLYKGDGFHGCSYAASEHLKALIAWIEALEKKIKKLQGRLEIEERAVERWVPCPDHRDKINHGYEEQRCYVCENETLKRKLKAMEAGDG